MLRLKRIPDLHVKEDDSATRGTRVLQILDELEQGGEGSVPELPETLPTPTGVSAIVPVPEPRAEEASHHSGERRDDGARRNRRWALTSLTPEDVAAVPAEVVSRIKGARTVLTVCHENPDADAFGSALAVALAVEELGGRATPVSADPVPSMYGFMPHIERIRQDPDPTSTTT